MTSDKNKESSVKEALSARPPKELKDFTPSAGIKKEDAMGDDQDCLQKGCTPSASVIETVRFSRQAVSLTGFHTTITPLEIILPSATVKFATQAA